MFFIFLEYVINLRVEVQNLSKNINFNSSCFKQTLDNYVFNISTCTLPASSSKICRFFLKLLGYEDQYVSQMFVILSITKSTCRIQFGITFT